MKYVHGCPACVKSKPPRHKPHGKLQPVPVPDAPLEVWGLDFITGLPESQGYNCLLPVTDKFSKALKLVPGKETWSAKEWASAIWDNVVRHWGLPRAIISDRDPKFTGGFWREVMEECRIILRLTTAYNPRSDGQSERMNQVVETMIRCLAVGQYESIWFVLIPQVEHNINASCTDATGISPFEILYGVPPRLVPTTLRRTNDFLQERINTRIAVRDALELAQARMAMRFDANHKPPELAGSAYIQLAGKDAKGYRLPNSSKISPIMHGPFPIKRKVNDLAYGLELPESMHIHPVISVVHLEPHVPDDWQRVLPEKPDPVIVDGEEQFEIEKILRQSVDKCLVRWKGLNEETWEPVKNLQEDVPELLRAFQRGQRDGRAKMR